GPYNEKEGSFYTIKEVWSPVHFDKRYITPAFDGSFRVENRFHFTDLTACRFAAEWVKVSAPGEPIVEKILAKENLAVRIPPGQSGAIQLELPGGWHGMDLL